MGATKLPQLGPCQVWFGAAGAEVELGKTKGVTLRLTEDTAPILYDQTGTGPWDLITVGKICDIECNFANLSYDLLEQVLPTEAEWYGASGTPTTGISNDALDIRLGLGTSHRDNAKRLILKPYVNGVVSPDKEDWIYAPLAFPAIDLTWEFDATNQRVVKAVFHSFPVSQNLPRILFLGAEAQLPLV
jgi:hypothetical protein